MITIDNGQPRGIDKFIDPKEFRAFVSKSMVHAEEAAEAMITSYNTCMNLDPSTGKSMGYEPSNSFYIYGSPGYGKSKLIELFIEFMRLEGIIAEGEEVFRLNFHKEMTADSIIGPLDMELFNKEGKFTKKVEEGFGAYRFAFFAEMSDASEDTLAYLKETLTSNTIKDGSRIYKLNTCMVVADSNIDPGEFSHSDTTQAIIERFPVEHHMTWPSHKVEDYYEGLKRSSRNKELSSFGAAAAHAAEYVNAKNPKRPPINPRKVGKLESIMIANRSVASYKHMGDFRSVPLNLLESTYKLHEEARVRLHTNFSYTVDKIGSLVKQLADSFSTSMVWTDTDDRRQLLLDELEVMVDSVAQTSDKNETLEEINVRKEFVSSIKDKIEGFRTSIHPTEQPKPIKPKKAKAKP
jgi:hypothetical protein